MIDRYDEVSHQAHRQNHTRCKRESPWTLSDWNLRLACAHLERNPPRLRAFGALRNVVDDLQSSRAIQIAGRSFVQLLRVRVLLMRRGLIACRPRAR